MALVSFNNIGITGIASCVPSKILLNSEAGADILDSEQLQKTIKTIGISERRIASDSICTSDLCFAAANKLFSESKIAKDEIDALIFVTQTPDFHLPATACVLQNRLGLSKDIIAYDINLGCSGYVYGLFNAFSLVNTEGINKVLLLVGDTISKLTSSKDKATGLLFGDAGTATLIESDNDASKTFFSLNTDGGGKDVIMVPAGAYRNPSTIDTLKIQSQEDGSIRNEEQLYLDGAEVFSFTIREVVKDIKKVLDYSNIPVESIDSFVLHQANKYMLDYLRKKLKVEADKMPISLFRFGNTSSASIPLTLVTQLPTENWNSEKLNMVMSGFGVGLSWATCLIELKNPNLLKLIEI